MQDQTNVEQWQNYVTFIDSIVADALLNAIGCRWNYSLYKLLCMYINCNCNYFDISSLCYISENMIPSVSTAPLLEACLELHEPDLVFTPSLDSNVEGNFCSIIQGVIEEIIELSKLMPRISDKNGANDYYVS
jgi:dynein heavy chain